MTEEVVYNVELGPRSCDIFCGWCTESFRYTETDQMHDHTTCPWCKAKIKIPRNRLRRLKLNGVRPHA